MQGTYLDPFMGQLGTLDHVAAERLVLRGLLLRWRGPDPLGGLGLGPLHHDGRDLDGPDLLNGRDI